MSARDLQHSTAPIVNNNIVYTKKLDKRVDLTLSDYLTIK